MTSLYTDSPFGELEISEIANLMAVATRMKLTENETEFIFSRREEAFIELSKERLINVLNNLKVLAVFEEVNLSSSNTLEIPLREHSNSPIKRRDLENIPEIIDGENKLTYKLGLPSAEYIIFTILKLRDTDFLREIFRMATIMVDRPGLLSASKLDMLDHLRRSLRIKSIIITSGKTIGKSSLINFSNAYLFSIGYNFDIALVPVKQLAELLRSYKIRKIRRANPNEMVAPRKHYIPDLIYYYQLGISSDSPTLEYLSFYHIIEHFFENIFNEDIIARLKDRITSESFSYKRDRDIKDLIKMAVANRTFTDDSVKVSEPEALRLTLVKFVPEPEEL
ncbi:hypothetical protein, partial [Deinococcus sp.]|uniref:hypothetical protein n=1 Tax=Deinococcus sp. TaxID=47478 RepID=UPI0025FFF700